MAAARAGDDPNQHREWKEKAVKNVGKYIFCKIVEPFFIHCCYKTEKGKKKMNQNCTRHSPSIHSWNVLVSDFSLFILSLFFGTISLNKNTSMRFASNTHTKIEEKETEKKKNNARLQIIKRTQNKLILV